MKRNKDKDNDSECERAKEERTKHYLRDWEWERENVIETNGNITDINIGCYKK